MKYDREPDNEHGRCAWTFGGERCRNPGSSSNSTRGDGPWYCVKHLFCGDAQRGLEIMKDSETGSPARAEEYVPAFTYRTPRLPARPSFTEVDGPEFVQYSDPGAHE